MPSEFLEAKFKSILASVADALKDFGFKKSGAKFRREVEGNLQLIEFQRSAWNDRDCLRFTANIGILSGKVLKKLNPDASMQKQTEIDAHLRKRLGEFRDEQTDFWWENLEQHG